MIRFVQTIIVIFLLSGCQKQTGYHALDSWIVTNYADRVILTQHLSQSATYCRFSWECMTICSMTPEPKNHWEEAVANKSKYNALTVRAKTKKLLLKLPERKSPVFSLREMPPMTDETISHVQKQCLTDQGERFKEIDQLLKKLGA